MAGYKFKMQNILNLKENIEEQKKNELGLSIKRLENEREKQARLQLELQSLCKEFEQKTQLGLPISELKTLLEFIDYCRKSIRKQQTMVKMAEDYVNTCREDVMKASQEKKMIEKLKEIDHKKFLYEEQKKEDKLVDDLVSFKESNK